MVVKPAYVFARDREWQTLTQFVDTPTDDLRLGIVRGRRRQGKTFLLQALAEATKGFYFVAVESTSFDALRQFGSALADYLNLGTMLSFANWDEAIGFLFDHCTSNVVILDEFPYLLKADPAIASILQREIDNREGAPRSSQRDSRKNSGTRLLLAGSAMSVMGNLLAGQAPLRGRASLDLVIQPFDYRLAAEFWQVEEPELAVRLNAIVGGTPAYRTRFVDNEAPKTLADFDDWVIRRVLSTSTPLFGEARYFLSNERDIRDEALYHSVLSAIATGNNTRGGIANYMGRKSTDLAHPLAVLEDCQLIRKEADPVRKGSPRYRVDEPLIAFYEAIMRVSWSQLELGRAEHVWKASQRRFSAQILGPHFEQLCRSYALRRTWDDQFPAEVAAGVSQGGRKDANIEVDVMVLGAQELAEKRRLLSLGEAKWQEIMTLRHLDRLRQASDQLHNKGLDTRDTIFALYSGAGFDHDLRKAASGDSRISLIDLHALYSD